MAQDNGDSLYNEAMDRFAQLFERAKASDLREPTAMTLATADGRGRPEARTVLLKQFDRSGFVFYSNQYSRKGQALADNPQAALLFFWQPLVQQVKVEGKVSVVTDREADDYWATRPRESQVAATASQQSAALASRDEFEARLAAVRERYAGQQIPRPPHWSGYRVVPDRIEFWREGEFRQHEREVYWQTDKGGWQWSLLNP